MDEKYDELLEWINWLTMIERFIDIFFFSLSLRPSQSVQVFLENERSSEYSEFDIGWKMEIFKD